MRKRQDPNIEGLDRTIEVPLPGGRSVRIIPLASSQAQLIGSNLRKAVSFGDVPENTAAATSIVMHDEDRSIAFSRLILLMTCVTIGLSLHDPTMEFETPRPRGLSKMSAGEWLTYAEAIEAEMEDEPGRFLLSIEDATAVASLLQKAAAKELADEKNG